MQPLHPKPMSERVKTRPACTAAQLAAAAAAVVAPTPYQAGASGVAAGAV